MRQALAIVVAIAVAACAVEQSSSERSFGGDAARQAQAALDAEAILQGMAGARDPNQWVARDLHQNDPANAPSAVTR